MKKLTLLFNLAAAALLLPLSSCLDDNDGNEWTTMIGYACYNHIYSINDGTSIMKAAGYTAELDLGKMTANLQIQGAYADNEETVTIRVEGIKLEYSEKNGYTFSATEAIPSEVSSGTPADYAISNLNGRIFSYSVYDSEKGTTRQVTVFETGFRLSNKYDVIATSTSPEFIDCDTQTTGGDEPFSTDATTYSVSFADANKATVTITNARFAADMPQMTMKLEEVPVSYNQGGYTLKADKVVPKIGGVPYDSYALTNFMLNVSSRDTRMSLRFDCNVQGNLYTVQSQGSVYPDTDNAN